MTALEGFGLRVVDRHALTEPGVRLAAG